MPACICPLDEVWNRRRTLPEQLVFGGRQCGLGLVGRAPLEAPRWGCMPRPHGGAASTPGMGGQQDAWGLWGCQLSPTTAALGCVQGAAGEGSASREEPRVPEDPSQPSCALSGEPFDKVYDTMQVSSWAEAAHRTGARE